MLSAIGTPARLAAKSSRISATSCSWFILARIPHGLPAAACSASRRIIAVNAERMNGGATIRRANSRGGVEPVSSLNTAATSAASSGSHDKSPRSS